MPKTYQVLVLMARRQSQWEHVYQVANLQVMNAQMVVHLSVVLAAQLDHSLNLDIVGLVIMPEKVVHPAAYTIKQPIFVL
jgi:hypothetical protein